ncbi:MAG: NfeD family protein [Lachnospiraceae bacterium]
MIMNAAVVWLILFVVLIVMELATLGLTTLWFAAGALVATIAATIGVPLYLQIILFLGVSAILLFFTRPIAVKYFNKDRVKTNAESLVGKQAVVTSDIDNLQGIGQVIIGGMEWSARAEDDEAHIPVGTITEVKGIHGVKLIVAEQILSDRKEEN